jgi:nitrogen-specific signal transduction histidine kinase
MVASFWVLKWRWMEWEAAGTHWAFLGAGAMLAGAVWRMARQTRMLGLERGRERRMRQELEAYARLDPSLAQGLNAGMDRLEAGRELARRVCRTVAEKSVFPRVTMLLRNAEGRFACVGSVATDDLTVAALHAWGERIVAEEREGRTLAGAGTGGVRTGAKSFAIPLGEWEAFDREVSTWEMSGRRERRRWRRGIVTPIRAQSGRMVGAIAVCADGAGVHGGGGWTDGVERAIGPIEALATRLATAMENEALTERLLRTEKLAGLGQLAGGVAHALNNPLTAVLGFAELIAETAEEPRVRKDAATILAEALKMKETVQQLVEFWRPAGLADEAVDVAEMLAHLGAACAVKLEARGVKMVVAAAGDGPPVRGSKDRLRQVFEHLLNNAAHSIATSREREAGEQHTIRVTVTHDEAALHVIVSDTGPGFKEPGRVFDPFYTTKGPDQGAGMGLSVCFGIMRDHGGEISAFNLHPHGAAVVVELPLRRVVATETVARKQGVADRA